MSPADSPDRSGSGKPEPQRQRRRSRRPDQPEPTDQAADQAADQPTDQAAESGPDQPVEVDQPDEAEPLNRAERRAQRRGKRPPAPGGVGPVQQQRHQVVVPRRASRRGNR